VYTALSIVAPQGANIASGRKTVEVRSWRPPILPMRDLLIVENAVFLDAEGEVDQNGRAVALVDVGEVGPWMPSQVEMACSEEWLSDYFAWQLENVRPILDPPVVSAERGLFRVHIAQPFVISKELSRSE